MTTLMKGAHDSYRYARLLVCLALARESHLLIGLVMVTSSTSFSYHMNPSESPERFNQRSGANTLDKDSHISAPRHISSSPHRGIGFFLVVGHVKNTRLDRIELEFHS